jgi:hypothetical protein
VRWPRERRFGGRAERTASAAAARQVADHVHRLDAALAQDEDWMRWSNNWLASLASSH